MANATDTLSTKQAADRLGLDVVTFRKLLKTGALSYTLVGTHKRVALEDLERYRQRHQPA